MKQPYGSGDCATIRRYAKEQLGWFSAHDVMRILFDRDKEKLPTICSELNAMVRSGVLRKSDERMRPSLEERAYVCFEVVRMAPDE